MRWLMVSLMMVLLTACSSQSGDSDDVPSRSASDLATIRAQAGIEPPTPTVRLARPTPTPRPPTATATTREQHTGYATDESLFDALLLPDDISPAWTLGGDDGIGSAAFCDGQAIEDQFEPLGWAYGSYSAVGGEWAEQWVIRMLEPDGGAAMEYARATFSCDRQTIETESGNDVYWDFEPLDAPSIGDDAYALRIAITYENPVYTPMVGTVIFARQGEFVVVVLHYGFRAQPELTEYMATVAIARLDFVRDSSV